MPMKNNILVQIRLPLLSSKLDPHFFREIMMHHGGEKVSLCYQCGVCSGSCPVGKLTNKFKIRNLIHMAHLGMRVELLSSDAIWLCTSCYTCQELCPQGIEVADLILAIRNIAVIEGHVVQSTLAQGLALIEDGRLVKPSRMTETRRAGYGLPAIPSIGVTAVKQIAEATEFNKVLEKFKSVLK